MSGAAHGFAAGVVGLGGGGDTEGAAYAPAELAGELCPPPCGGGRLGLGAVPMPTGGPSRPAPAPAQLVSQRGRSRRARSSSIRSIRRTSSHLDPRGGAQLEAFRVVGDAWGACERSGPPANISSGRAGFSGEGCWRGATVLEAGFALFRRGAAPVWARVRLRVHRLSTHASGAAASTAPGHVTGGLPWLRAVRRAGASGSSCPSSRPPRRERESDRGWRWLRARRPGTAPSLPGIGWWTLVNSLPVVSAQPDPGPTTCLHNSKHGILSATLLAEGQVHTRPCR